MPIKNKADYKYYIEQDRIALKRKKCVFKDNIWKYEIILRKVEYWNSKKKNIFSCIIVKCFNRRLFALGRKCGGFCIFPNNFGPGLSIAHYGSIVVNSAARIGKNCRIHEGVTIGSTGSSAEAAIIGDNCFLASGCKVIGAVKIGDDVAIGANAVVVKSYEENGITLGGVPAHKISNNNSRAFLSQGLFERKKEDY